MILFLAIAGLVLAAIPAAMYLKNAPLFCERLDLSELGTSKTLSVLIPARDEESGISASIQAALDSEGVGVEVIVLDDHSSDRTAEIVHGFAANDSRVRYLAGKELPADWNGKQFACFQLAEAASASKMVFLDADVCLEPDALGKLCQRFDSTGVGLLSAFPAQETGTTLEKWIIPMMHNILLGYLPMHRMRDSVHPAYAAGCGQLFLTTKSDYIKAGTHEAIKESRHDGVKLPKAYRIAGLSTDVVDGTKIARCRMYQTGGQVIRGVLKNATEGIANPRVIVVFTILLVGGIVLPVVLLPIALVQKLFVVSVICVASILLGHLPRALAAKDFRQPISGVVFHSVATLLFVFLQWIALLSQLLGRQVQWRGRD